MSESQSQDTSQKSDPGSSGSSPPLDPKKIEAAKLSENIQLMEAARLAAKRDELAELEKRVDAKLIELKKFVELTKVSGETMAGAAVTKTKEQLEIDECNKLLKDTGLHI